MEANAHRKGLLRDGGGYPVCIAEIAAAIASPTFIGQAPGHNRNFEMIRRIGHADRSVVLVAIGLESDDRGNYRVRTCYLLEARKVEERRQRGRLKLVIPR